MASEVWPLRKYSASMSADPKEKIRAAVRRAQADFEQAQSQRDEASAARRKNFERAQTAGLSIREIARESGLHFSRVAEILQGK
ncbi:MAG: hypothetical protein JST08_11085 [Actinobacteria bacterium]|nr:hypothetical protein [Actinomycetota bacterium]